MTRSLSTHPTDEALERFADGLLSSDEARKIETHLAGCADCTEIVIEARRGLAMLALASLPPDELAQLARARRWSAAHDSHIPASLRLEDHDDLAEVVGRDIEAEEPPPADPDEDNSPDEKR